MRWDIQNQPYTWLVQGKGFKMFPSSFPHNIIFPDVEVLQASIAGMKKEMEFIRKQI